MEPITYKIDQNFVEIESKLKNAFSAIKVDMHFIKDQLNKVGQQKQHADDSQLRELTKQIISLKQSLASKDDLVVMSADFENRINTLKKSISKSGLKEAVVKSVDKKLESKLRDIKNELKQVNTKLTSEIAKTNNTFTSELTKTVNREAALERKTSELRKQISKQGLKNAVKAEVSEELTLNFNNKFQKQQEKFDSVRKEMNSDKHDSKKIIAGINTIITKKIEESNKDLFDLYELKTKELDLILKKHQSFLEHEKKKQDSKIKDFEVAIRSDFKEQQILVDEYTSKIDTYSASLKRAYENGKNENAAAADKKIKEHKELVDNYSSKIEDYTAKLESDYDKAKRDIKSGTERKINDLRKEKDEEISNLQGQISYLKGRLNQILGKEVVVKKEEKKVEAKKEEVKKGAKAEVKTKGFFSKIIDALADDAFDKPVKNGKKVESKPEVKKITIELKTEDKKDIKNNKKDDTNKNNKDKKSSKKKGFFGNLISSLSDD